MKKLILIFVALIAIVSNAAAQKEQKNNPYVEYIKIGSDSLKIIHITDTIDERNFVDYRIYDSYQEYDKTYFIFSRQELHNDYMLNENDDIVITTSGEPEKFYTTEPNTKIIVTNFYTNNNYKAIKYTFFTDYRSNLSESELDLFAKFGLLRKHYGYTFYDTKYITFEINR